MPMFFKPIPLDKIGEFIQALHNCRVEFSLERVVSGSIQWYLISPGMNTSMLNLIANLTVRGLDTKNDMRVIAGLMAIDFINRFGEDKTNTYDEVFKFLIDNGFRQYFLNFKSYNNE